MRNHTEESPNGLNEDVKFLENRKSGKNRFENFQEDEFRFSRQESGPEYHRDSLLNIEDQVETSKLVLQLVTDSRFNMTQINGQRKLGGPPPGWKGPAPGPGCEVFVGKIPRTLYEHEIYPIFRRMGEVYEIRLMMDFSGTNRGYCFVMFGKPEFAQRAIQELDNFEIRPGRRIGVVASINNCRLYIGQLPPDVISETVIRKIYDITDDVAQVSVYRNANDQARYALISYRTHRGAAMARRRLVPDRASLFCGGEVSIDWAHPSMLPSNVVEDTGTCDDHGNIEISRLVVGSENKRYQNRRRVRDDFLDHSIRAYLQTDRAVLDHQSRIKQNLLQNQSFTNSLNTTNRGMSSNFHMYNDQNANCRGQNYINRQNSRPDKNRCKLGMARKLRDSNSSFDSNVASGESESSGCSSQSSASERHNNFSKEFLDPPLSDFYTSQIFYNDDNKEIFSDETKIEDKIFSNRSNESLDKKFGKKETDSLNLFDNYTFSVNCRENCRDFKDVENNGDDFTSGNFENNSTDNKTGKIINEEKKFPNYYDTVDNLVSKISNDSNVKRESVKNNREMQRCKNYLNQENNNIGDNSINDFNALHKSVKYNLKSQDFGDLVTFPKTVGIPIKNEHFKSQGGSNPPNFYRHQNRNGIGSVMLNKNGKISSASRIVTENYLMQQQQHCENGGNRSTLAYTSGKIANPSNVRNFSYGINSGGKRAWLSTQFGKGCEFSSKNLGNNSINKNSTVYSESELQQSSRRMSVPSFTSRVNSSVINFYPGQGFLNFTQIGPCQNGKKYSNGRNEPINGRPILSRSYASLCDEN